MSHNHDHTGHDHAHGHSHAHGVTDSRRVAIAFFIIFVFMLVEVAGGAGDSRTAVVRPRQEFGVRFRARIGPCGPPHAALLVLS